MERRDERKAVFALWYVFRPIPDSFFRPLNWPVAPWKKVCSAVNNPFIKAKWLY